MRGVAVVAGIAVSDRHGDLLAKLRADGSATQRAERPEDSCSAGVALPDQCPR
jgi:hypothetical protein